MPVIDAPSTRRRFAVAVLGLFLLIVTACGTLTGDAASVGGATIADDEVRDQLALAAEFADLNPGVADVFVRSGESTFSMDSAVIQLDTLVRSEAMGQILDDLGGEVTSGEVDATTAQFEQFEDNGWLDGFIEAESRTVAVERILRDEVDLSIGSPEEWFEINEALFSNVVCARHILVATPEEAQAVYTRIVDDGEAFEDVAAEVGTDGTAAQGGDLGCQPAETYVPEFATELSLLDPGAVSLPFPTDFGWHVARVDTTADELTYDDVADQVVAQYEAEIQQELGGQIQLRLSELFEDLDISVSSRYGVWDDISRRVVSPGVSG